MTEEMNVNALFRPHLASVKPYSNARSEFSGEASVFLDANENPYDPGFGQKWNRYPDPLQKKLREKWASLRGLPTNMVFTGNGSDEVLDLLVRSICEPGKDRIGIMPPTYGMYTVLAAANNVDVIKVPLLADFSINLKGITGTEALASKLFFICSPNNPTGTSIDPEDLRTFLSVYRGLCVVDEAYIDFSPKSSVVPLIEEFPNLVVCQTLSKAWGGAGLRIGFLIADPEVISILDRIKLPYNVNSVSADSALALLNEPERAAACIEEVGIEREKLSVELFRIHSVENVFPSDANFLLVRFRDADGIYRSLLKRGIVVRNQSHNELCRNCIRITIGTPLENETLLDALRDTGSTAAQAAPAFQASGREAVVIRRTSETSIAARVLVDGNRKTLIRTGIGFFDHMLQLLGFHAGWDLEIRASGDLYVDEHHTVEDTALVLGQALSRIIGESRAIERYSFILPMDEAKTTLALDISGRGGLVWNVPGLPPMLGSMPSDLIQHFFTTLCQTARITLNVESAGTNGHHIVESIFKAFGRALKDALALSRQASVSSKGCL